MSWNGTVRCGYCYKSGHNKRTCPEYTERVLERAARENDPDGYWTKIYVKRTGLNPDGTDAPKEAKRQQVRRCTYCGAKGHNRRTCEVLKRNIAEETLENKAFRVKLLAEMEEKGLGVGALVKAGWDQKVRMVAEIKWDFMNHKTVPSNNAMPIIICEIANPRRRDSEYLPLMGECTEHSWGRDRCQVVSPIHQSAVTNTMPADWLTGRSGIKAMFDKDTKSACYWDNYYER